MIEVLGSPHLVLPDICADDRVRAYLAQLLHDILRLKPTPLKFQGKLFFPLRYFVVPFVSARGLREGDKLLKNLFRIADDGNVDSDVFADLRRIYIYVDNLGTGAKLAILPVTLSSNLTPIAMMRSDSVTA